MEGQTGRKKEKRSGLLLLAVVLLTLISVVGSVREYELTVRNQELEDRLLETQEELGEVRIQERRIFSEANLSRRGEALGLHVPEPRDMILVYIGRKEPEQ